MRYFANFPLVRRQMGGREVLGMNIAKRAYIPREYFNDSAYYMAYEVQDGETPEMIADRFYDDVDLYWVILHFNQIMDIHDGWPMSTYALDQYIQRTYGNDVYSVRYYESADTGARVSSDWPDYDRIPITNWDHETRENDRKRQIKLLLPDYVDDVVAKHKEILRRKYRAL